MSIGSIHGGTIHNVIPRTCRMLGTVRAFAEDVREQMPERIERVLNACCDAAGATYDFTYLHRYPVTANDPARPRTRGSSPARVVGDERVIDVAKLMGAEDFSYLRAARSVVFLHARRARRSVVGASAPFEPFRYRRTRAAERRRDDDRARPRRVAQRAVIPEVVEPKILAGYFEVMTRAVFQAGVAWKQIASNWEHTARLLRHSIRLRSAQFNEFDVERVLETPGILRMQRKVRATIANAARCRRNRARIWKPAGVPAFLRRVIRRSRRT